MTVFFSTIIYKSHLISKKYPIVMNRFISVLVVVLYNDF